MVRVCVWYKPHSRVVAMDVNDLICVWHEEDGFSATLMNAKLANVGSPTLEDFYQRGMKVHTSFGYQYMLNGFVLDWDVRRSQRRVYKYE